MSRVLVIGATGMLGKSVVRCLQAGGVSVRVLTRRPIHAQGLFGDEIQVVNGDVQDPQVVQAALADCTGVHLSLNGGFDADLERRAALVVVQAARQANLERITYLSGASVCAENCWYAGTKAKFEAEAAIRDAGVPYTIFKATYFMESLSRFVHGRRALLIGKQAFPWHWVAADDYAHMVTRAYANPAAADRSLFVYGPQALTMRDALLIYCRRVHLQAKLTPLPIPVARFVAWLGERRELQAALPFFAYCERVREAGDPSEANTLLGAPTTTLDEWCTSQVVGSPIG